MRQGIIIATGNEGLDELIKADLEEAEIGTVVAKVTTRNTLVKRFMETEAALIFIGEELIGEESTDDEWERTIGELRRISLQVRIVYMCQRPADDMFLTKLTTYSVYDIFNEGQLPPSYVDQLQKPPAYKNIEKFRLNVEAAVNQMAEKSREQRAEEIISQGVNEKKPRVIRVVEEREKRVEVPVYEQVYIQPQLIVVASAFSGAGSSIFSRMFAEYIRSFGLLTGIVESPYAQMSWFELLNGTKVLRDTKQGHLWKSWHRQIAEGESVEPGTELTSNGVGYMIRHREDNFGETWGLMHTAHLVGFARHYPVLIYDLSTGLGDEREKIILRQANKVILVSGYDPIRVNREHASYKEILAITVKGKLIVIANKTTPWLHKEHVNSLQQAYGVDHIYSMPLVTSIPDIYMSSESFWESSFTKSDVRESVKATFEEIATELFTADLMKKLVPKEKRGLLSRITGGFRRDHLQAAVVNEQDDSPA
ncbi:hypothetical protein SAMN04487897_10963 [Paenibacillus sp. yr247]|nr:hypothetical protein SAMN04487897_10963 [Paenibacillus sp. yr247]